MSAVCFFYFYFIFLFSLGYSVGVTREFETTLWFFSLLSAVAMEDVVHGVGFYKGYDCLQVLLEKAQAYAYFL